jgi:type VI secretion system secreted protein Hcp
MALAIGLIVATPPLVGAQEIASDEPGVYVSFPGLSGELAHEDRSDWIDVLSIDWGMDGNSALETGTERMCAGYRTGGTVVGGLTLTRPHDGSPSAFARACAEGTHFPIMVVETTSERTGLGRHMRYELQDAMITAYSIDTSGDAPTESISFDYTKVDSRVIPATQRGKLDPAWNPEFAGP